VMTDLGILLGGGDFVDSIAWAVNNRGQVVGSSSTTSGVQHAFIWEDGTVIDLGTLGGLFSSARAINKRGQIVGVAEDANGDDRAVLWEDGTITDLGTLGGPSSHARGINDRGQLVGESTTAEGALRAFLWEDGQMIELRARLPGGSAFGFDINRDGDVVGGDNHAVLWTNRRRQIDRDR
jgi:probable HAF family extracellular repeat protein